MLAPLPYTLGFISLCHVPLVPWSHTSPMSRSHLGPPLDVTVGKLVLKLSPILSPLPSCYPCEQVQPPPTTRQHTSEGLHHTLSALALHNLLCYTLQRLCPQNPNPLAAVPWAKQGRSPHGTLPCMAEQLGGVHSCHKNPSVTTRGAQPRSFPLPTPEKSQEGKEGMVRGS